MALLLPSSVFIHAPKTGGWWVRNAIRDAGVRTVEAGHEHCNFKNGLLRHHPVEWWSGRTAFMFVRHPLAWYQSIWAFRVKNGWSMIHPLDFNCASNDFHTFVSRALDWWPSGWVTKTLSEFASVPDGVNLLVGRQERLRADLATILAETGDLPSGFRLDTPPANDSTMDGRSSSELAAYTPELRRRVLSVERAVIERWYQPGWEGRGLASK